MCAMCHKFSSVILQTCDVRCMRHAAVNTSIPTRTPTAMDPMSPQWLRPTHDSILPGI